MAIRGKGMKLVRDDDTEVRLLLLSWICCWVLKQVLEIQTQNKANVWIIDYIWRPWSLLRKVIQERGGGLESIGKVLEFKIRSSAKRFISLRTWHLNKVWKWYRSKKNYQFTKLSTETVKGTQRPNWSKRK